MNNQVNNLKLTEGDRKTISSNSDICTDSHGKGCTIIKSSEIDKKHE